MAMAKTLAQDPGRAEGLPAAGELLADIAAGLSGGVELPQLLQRFLEPIVQLAGAQGGAVRVMSEAGNALQPMGHIGMPEGVCGTGPSVDRQCGHCGAAAARHEAVWAEDLSDCAARNDGQFFGQQCQRLLALPLQHRGEVLGVYNLFFAARQPAPPPAVLSLLKSAGELLGLALQQARLERAHLQARVLQERQVLAAEVHDSLGQSLAFIKMRLALLEDALGGHDEVRARGYCADLRSAATQAHGNLRGLLTQLRSPMDPLGLDHALQASAENFRRQTDTQLDFVNALPGMALGADREAQVFHIVREALSNVARHAAAQHAWLHIGQGSEGQARVCIEDDGAGLPQGGVRGDSHYGLEIMLERARRLGGTLSLGARDGGGTSVVLEFPLAAATAVEA